MLLELFLVFFKLGAFNIGGGMAMVPILRDEMVNKKAWFQDEEMVDIIAISQSLPGVLAINMATYVGFRKKGLLGSLVATIGVVLPSFIIIVLIAMGVAQIGDNRFILGALAVLRASAVGLIVGAIWQVGSMVVKDIWSGALALLSFLVIQFAHISIAWVVLAYLIGGALYYYVKEKRGGAVDDPD